MPNTQTRQSAQEAMTLELEDVENSNFELFRDCLSSPLINKCMGEPKKPPKKRRIGQASVAKTTSAGNLPLQDNDATELGDFVDVRIQGICFEHSSLSPVNGNGDLHMSSSRTAHPRVLHLEQEHSSPKKSTPFHSPLTTCLPSSSISRPRSKNRLQPTAC